MLEAMPPKARRKCAMYQSVFDVIRDESQPSGTHHGDWSVARLTISTAPDDSALPLSRPLTTRIYRRCAKPREIPKWAQELGFDGDHPALLCLGWVFACESPWYSSDVKLTFGVRQVVL